MYPPRPLKLDDCIDHGPGTELYVVEGDSASSAVCRVRDERYQAVLPMQGKPLNAIKATPKKVAANPWFAALTQALGTGIGDAFDLSQARYERVILLMDPDADGIHCGALLLMFFRRWIEPLLTSGRIAMARAPMATIQANGTQFHVRSEQEHRAQSERLMEAGISSFETVRYRGLAGMDLAVLAATCVEPATRVLTTVEIADADSAIAVFGGDVFARDKNKQFL
jgi:DNA gyrase subunit B